jgi:(2R)-3-sulfolactate dehydrogenase (NADP+)
MTPTVTLSQADLEALIARALAASRTSEANARSVARALAQAEIDGQKGHGLSRVPSYAAQAKAGKVDGYAVPVARHTMPASLVIDAANGFAYPALDIAIERLPGLARTQGLAAAAVTRSHHFGVAGRVVERIAEQRCVALVMGNTPVAMAAWGGRRPVFGTNPLAFAAPMRMRPPLVVDLALSVVARGRIVQAAEKNQAIPPDWALDESGRPTTDARAALRGSLLPLGGAKGAALAFMVEVMAAALTGANLSFAASSFFDDQGGPPGVGQFVLAIEPSAFSGAEAFAGRMTELAATIEAEAGVRLPGSRRLAAREKAAREGVAVDGELLARVAALAG